MEFKGFQQTVHKLVSQRNSLLIAVVALSIATIRLTLAPSKAEQRIIVVPTQGPSYWLEETSTSNEYIHYMGSYLSDLLFTRTPSDVQWRNKEVLKHAHPERYAEIKKALNKEAEELERKQSALWFVIESSYVSENQDFVVEGSQRAYVENSKKIDSLIFEQSIQYILSFRCENGRLWLVNIEKQEKNYA